MTQTKIEKNTDYIFEVSWEVCNKVGGIYTVLSTKAASLVKHYKDNLIMIGPDIWKDTDSNPYFQEDKYLFKSWREYAESKGFRIKVGRWKIQGKPITILIDFTTLFSRKDEIFASLWETYKLDSITGQWDYIEPALFGYAAGMLIENFYEFNHSAHDRIVAHFHEWMSGGGLLYVKSNVPQIGTIFTTHATVLGRCLAGNGLPLYDKLEEYNPEQKAHEFNVRAKFSMEKTCASVADCFTTVSIVTAREAKHFLGRNPDIITPNGFEDSFVPCGELFEKKRIHAKEKIKNLVEKITKTSFNENSITVAISGRYEFRNKGIDIFIDALGYLNKYENLPKEIYAFLLIPANNYGPRKDLISDAQKEEMDEYADPSTDIFLTHRIHDKDYDAILNRIKYNNLHNTPNEKVKIFFVPSYLNGHDGIINLDYYDFLIGFDLTVFASYYEPWGYTPLESIAFHIPTITTSLTGFTSWLRENNIETNDGVTIIERNDHNDKEVIEAIAKKIVECSAKSPEEKQKARDDAQRVSKLVLWKHFIKYYEQAYGLAIEKVKTREHLYSNKKLAGQTEIVITKEVKPLWRRVVVQPNIPEKLKALREIANNLWWSWNHEAIDLFESIDLDLWKKNKGNPIAFLDSLSYEQLLKLESDRDFLDRLNYVTSLFKQYLAEKNNMSKKLIAYFSMEYGFHDSLKIFSGGLGILAGDYLKEASDRNINLVGIGLLYRYGYFLQKLSSYGEQLSILEPQPFSKMPISPVRDEQGNWKLISIAFPGRTVYARIWRVDVGRISLYLLDTDFDANTNEDRTITHQLYGGDWENRLKQELLLGVGGIRALEVLGIKPDIYHCNEGHAAFICIERLKNIMQNYNLTFSEASEIVKASTLFTTHTPVPAGHDAFSEDLLRTYIPHYAARLNLTWEEFMNLGRVEGKPDEKFSMSVLAAKFSSYINGVSRIHGRVTQKMFNNLWKGYFPQELHIGYVTNGVHYPTWAAKRWRNLYEKEFGKEFIDDQSNEKYWKKIYDVPDKVIWEIRQKQRKELLDFVKEKTIETWTARGENPQRINKIVNSLNYDALTIGFARRFAAYKRAYLLFQDLERLSKIVNIPGYPVQFIFAGKAHPNDKQGQDLIKLINDIANKPEFFGKIIFVENYDIYLAKKLVQGVDVWLNTPMRPLEASGTSGQKAVLNGVLNLSVLDGWWAEGYVPKAGWALKEEITYEKQDFQDALDAVTIYNIIENEIIPLFYNRNSEGIPTEWVSYIKNCIANICPHFNMKRMLDDYFNKFYNKMFERVENITNNNFKLAKELASWKKKVARSWDSIEVVSINLTDISSKMMKLGERFEAEIILDLKELSIDDIGVEVIFVESGIEQDKIIFKGELHPEEIEDKRVRYTTKIYASRSGIFNCGFRLYPKNPNLAHRQDFELVKWI